MLNPTLGNPFHVQRIFPERVFVDNYFRKTYWISDGSTCTETVLSLFVQQDAKVWFFYNINVRKR